MEQPIPESIKKTLSIGIFISLLCYSPVFLDGALVSKWTALGISLLLITFQLLLFRSKVQVSLNRNMQVAFILYLAYLLFRTVSVSCSSNLADGLFDLSKEFLFLILLFTLIIIYKERNDFLRSIKLPFLTFISIVFLVISYQFLPLIFNASFNAQASYEITSIFAHRNMLAHVLVLSFPLLFLFDLKQNYTKWLNWSVIVLIFVILYFLYCRTAWVALLSGLLLSLAYYLLVQNDRQTTFQFVMSRSKLIVGILLTVLFFIFLDLDEFTKQWHSLSHWHYGSVNNRLKLWEATSELIAENPLFGTGLSSWKIEILRFIASSDLTNGGFIFYQRPHNDFLWIWSESGILPLMAYLLFFLFVIFKAVKREFSKVNLACFFGITAYLVIANLSFPKERMEHQVFLSFYVFLMLSETKPNKHIGIKLKMHYLWLAALLLIGIITVFAFRMIGEYYTIKAFVLKDDNWNKKIELLNKAESELYMMDATSTPLAYHRGLFRLNLGQNEKAESDFEHALTLNPNHLHVLNYYASIKYGNGQIEEAKELYQRILQLKPDHNDALVNLAVISTRNDDVNNGLQHLSSVDIENVTEQHKGVILAILKVKMKNLQESSEDLEYIQEIQQMRFNDAWIYEMFEKSILENRTFEEQVDLDVQYLIENR